MRYLAGDDFLIATDVLLAWGIVCAVLPGRARIFGTFCDRAHRHLPPFISPSLVSAADLEWTFLAIRRISSLPPRVERPNSSSSLHGHASLAGIAPDGAEDPRPMQLAPELVMLTLRMFRRKHLPALYGRILQHALVSWPWSMSSTFVLIGVSVYAGTFAPCRIAVPSDRDQFCVLAGFLVFPFQCATLAWPWTRWV